MHFTIGRLRRMGIDAELRQNRSGQDRDKAGDQFDQRLHPAFVPERGRPAVFMRSSGERHNPEAQRLTGRDLHGTERAGGPIAVSRESGRQAE